MSYLVGPYAALAHGIDEAGREEVYGALRESTLVSGFEIPFRAPWTQEDVVTAARRVGPDRDVVLTTMPGLVGQALKEPRFGPASADTEGRSAALEFLAEARRAATRLGEELGPDRVRGVTIASAPRAGSGVSTSSTFLSESLEAMLDWPWGATRIVVEHCDALVAGRPAAKGFLPLDAELRAVAAANRSRPGSVGIAINWGRSVIETRDPALVPQHVRAAAASGDLFGLIFSGSSGTETEYGAAWADVHLPPTDDAVVTHGAGSLLTREEMRRSLAALDGSEPLIGLKVTAPRRAEAGVRAEIILNSLSLLAEAAREPVAPLPEAI